jgi:hypothetical protein
MYIPQLDAVLKHLNIDRDHLDYVKSVDVPISLLKLLLQIAVAAGDFNEAGYLASNPDIEAAVKQRKVDDPKMHYIRFGYFEGRKGATPPVDERWYRNKYPDVATAINSGALQSAAEHFEVQGAFEGRPPSASFEADAQEWKKAFGQI